MTNIKGQHNDKSNKQNTRIRVSDLYSKKRFWDQYISRIGTSRQSLPKDGLSYIISVICDGGHHRELRNTLAAHGMEAYRYELTYAVFKYISFHGGFVPQSPAYTIIDYTYDLMNMCNQPHHDVVSFLVASDKLFEHLISVLTQIDTDTHWFNVTPDQFAAMCNHEFSKKLKSYAESMKGCQYAKRS